MVLVKNGVTTAHCLITEEKPDLSPATKKFKQFVLDHSYEE
ncbi:hypothetical protein (plasmid) [Metabacillus dongyingensis]|nr:hypothetical protein [Metabacillus dongyingensis]